MDLSQSARPYLANSGILRATHSPLPTVNIADLLATTVVVPLNSQVLNPDSVLDPEVAFAVAPEFQDV